MINRRVLVTRPQPGAARTAARLVKLSFDPVILPLTKIVALPHDVPATLPDLVVATSQQAFRHLSAAVATKLASLPVIVTGKASAAAAREAGFLDVVQSGGDVSELISLLSSRLKPGEHILYLAGRVRRPELEHDMVARRLAVDVAEVYDTIPVSHSTDKILGLGTDGEVNAVLLTSVTSANRFVEIAATYKQAQLFDNAIIICLSERIADALKHHLPNPVAVASAPTEDALLNSLATALSSVR